MAEGGCAPSIAPAPSYPLRRRWQTVPLLVLFSVAGITAGQLLLKKGMVAVGQFHDFRGLMDFFLKTALNPYVIVAAFLILLASLAWFVALSRAELSSIYPFMALSYVLVVLFSLLIFREEVSLLRWVGITMTCVGVVLVSRS